MADNNRALPIRRVQRASVAPAVEVVKFEKLAGNLPIVVRSPGARQSLAVWLRQQAPLIERALLDHGGILFRGFSVGGLEGFRDVVTFSGAAPLEYTYRSTPRTELGHGIYTSTEYPARQSIPFHNENSYSDRWPRWLFFYCDTPSASGGETPIADSYQVHERIPVELRQRFASKGVMYVRNYGQGADLPWQEVFQTVSRDQVEQFCQEHSIQVEWRGKDGLRTRQVCQAVVRHPLTGKTAWFNQAHLFHISSLEMEMREALLEVFEEHDLPRNAFYGDGSAIAAEDLDIIRAAYAQQEVCFVWEAEDVLLIDNIAVAHGRRPFEGERRIRVGMV